MNRVIKLLALGTVLSLLAALAVVPATAQDQCCQGGTIIEGNLGGDVAHTNPIEAGDTASTRVSASFTPASSALILIWRRLRPISPARLSRTGMFRLTAPFTPSTFGMV